MASNTTNLGLLKKDPVTDGADTFNIKTMLNENWDKVDEAVGNKAEQTDLTEHINDQTKHIGTETKTTPVDTDSVPLVDSADGGNIKRFSIANLKTFLNGLYASITHSHAWSAITDKPTSFTPTSHATNATTYGKAGSSDYGHVRLNDSYTSDLNYAYGIASTPKAVKTAYDKAVSAYNLANGGTKIATGSYVGTGTYGDGNETSIILPFTPKFLFVSPTNPAVGFNATYLFLIYGMTQSRCYWKGTTVRNVDLEWNGNSVSWYQTEGAVYQLNATGATYQYVALG